MDFEKRLSKIVDNLSIKYDFFYLIKNNKLTFSLLFIIYLIFIIYVVYEIYTKHTFQGIIDNIFPFFVDIAIVFLITVTVLVIRIIYNDEDGRINEDEKENLKIYQLKNFNVDINNIEIIFNKEEYYSQPQLIENLLKWIDFDKDDYFRTHYGSLDISKIAVKRIVIEDNKLKIHCNQASFYDIAYTHYFPDYKLSSSSSTDSKNIFTLRSLLKNNLDETYSSQKLLSNSIELFNLLPNPLGLTGIVTLNFNNKNYYILQVRHKSEAAAKNKIQWSFAGTIDTVPNLYKDKISFKELIDNELNDEIIDIKNSPFTTLKDCKKEYRLIGFVLNPLYLYQPEFFTNVTYDINDNKHIDLQNYIIDNEKSFSKYLNDGNDGNDGKISNFIILSDLKMIQKIMKHKDLKVRNLFKPGYDFLTREVK
ncbi:hypothetical protein [Candidatus Sulfurimonas baltica]|uniref:Uncharacterized protein n=1 Tax=Candidatus Sulfurimonas baltica TaxID=2740404 RepID=A0A7S7RMK1_9BACT|nr:hypothetical protein [Candidatus Sulfurimonas baltica]QOY52317.1 hypothetical protein HUE88_01085 [Candidatus Sulfurimonas baltica]